MEDDDIVEIQGAPVVPRPDPPPAADPLLDTGTKVALVAFVIALVLAVAAIVVAVVAY